MLPAFLPYMQLGVVRDRVRGAKTSLLQQAYATFSKLGKMPVPPVTALPHGMSLWQNVSFRNLSFHTYYSPFLVRKEKIVLGHVLNEQR